MVVVAWYYFSESLQKSQHGIGRRRRLRFPDVGGALRGAVLSPPASRRRSSAAASTSPGATRTTTALSGAALTGAARTSTANMHNPMSVSAMYGIR